jgi:hypothetical protein
MFVNSTSNSTYKFLCQMIIPMFILFNFMFLRKNTYDANNLDNEANTIEYLLFNSFIKSLFLIIVILYIFVICKYCFENDMNNMNNMNNANTNKNRTRLDTHSIQYIREILKGSSDRTIRLLIRNINKHLDKQS